MSRNIMVKLQSSDGQMFEVEQIVAEESMMLRNLIDDCGTDDTIPLQVASKILSKIVEYARYHVEARNCSDEMPSVPDDEIEKWDANFIQVDEATISELVLAADYLLYTKLFDFARRHIVSGETPE